jgi:hypothetical protein
MGKVDTFHIHYMDKDYPIPHHSQLIVMPVIVLEAVVEFHAHVRIGHPSNILNVLLYMKSRYKKV